MNNLNQLSHDISKGKHNTLQSCVEKHIENMDKDKYERERIKDPTIIRSSKTQIRESIQLIIQEKMNSRLSPVSVLRGLTDLDLHYGFVADVLTEVCVSIAFRHYTSGKTMSIEYASSSVVNKLLEQNAVEAQMKLKIDGEDASERKDRIKEIRKSVVNKRKRMKLLDGLDKITMKQQDKVSLGNSLLNLALMATISTDNHKVFTTVRNHKNNVSIVFHDDFIEYANMKDENIATNYHTKLPVYELDAWTDFNNGGFKDQYVPLIKSDTPQKYSNSPIPESILNTTNILQNVKYEIDMDMYRFVQLQRSKNSKMLGLYSFNCGEDIKKTQFSFCKKAMKYKQGSKRRNLLLKSHFGRKAERIEKLQESQGKFYQQNYSEIIAEAIIRDGNNPVQYVHTGDYRFRFYINASALNVQSCKVTKNMMSYYNKVEYGEMGMTNLMYMLSALYEAKLEDGCKLSKATRQERIDWGFEHYDFFLKIGNDLLGNVEHIEEAGEPLEFAKTCLELARVDAWIKSGNSAETFKSGHIARLDATTSGSQVCSIILRDKTLAKSVNVCDNETGRVSDYYGIHADIFVNLKEKYQSQMSTKGLELAKKYSFFSEYHEVVNRTTMKKPCMCYVYSLTPRGGEDYFIAEFKQNKEIKKEHYKPLAKVLWEVIQIGGGAVTVLMKWFQGAVRAIKKANKDAEFSWPCPDGLICWDIRYKSMSKEFDTILGNKRYIMEINTDSDEIKLSKNTSSVSPSIVHSVDKSLMSWTINYLHDVYNVRNFSAIHDSCGTNLAHVHFLVEAVNYAHLKLYNINYIKVLKDYWESMHNIKLDDMPFATNELSESDIKTASNPWC